MARRGRAGARLQAGGDRPGRTTRRRDRGAWPADHELLGAAAGMSPEEVAPLRYGAGRLAPPRRAARRASASTRSALLARRARARATDGEDADRRGRRRPARAADATATRVCDLAAALGLPLLIAARPGPRHDQPHPADAPRRPPAPGWTCARSCSRRWPAQPSALERSNRETIARLGEVEVQTLAPVRGPDQAELARAGGALPWRRWLAGA